ncbi:MAG: hypothetical protein OHK006_19890 [Thermodesulfovibrionales bacterium]
MGCEEITGLSNREFFSLFEKKAARLRTPLFGSLELTSRCNLRCVHCYLGPPSADDRIIRDELDTAEILSVLDQITEAGCFHLLLTGGEPFMRKDFAEIYRHAKKNGLLLTVFSNGTLVTTETAGLLAEFPPRAVEISLYGATEKTCAELTGRSSAYHDCLRGIRMLLDAGVPVKLKTLLTRMNAHEFPDIERHAHDFGVEFRFDAALFPKFDGDRTPVSLRVSPEDAVEMEFSDPDRRAQWQNYFDRMVKVRMPDTLYFCGAGSTSFHVDSYGNLKPCLMVQSPAYSLRTGDFAAGWRDAIAAIREKRPEAGYRCSACDRATLCGHCPAFFSLETGSEQTCASYLCETGSARFERLRSRSLQRFRVV